MQSLQEILGAPSHSGNEVEWQTNDLRLKLRTRSLGALGAPLDVSTGRRNDRDRLEVAVRSRVERVQAELSSGHDVPCGAVIELSGAEVFKKSNDDPKQALRAAFATTNRLSQFITPSDMDESAESLLHRAKASWHDLLRQLGVCPEFPDTTALGLPSPVRIVGLWLIKRVNCNGGATRSRFLPVATYMDTREAAVYASVNGLDGLYSYPDALLAIGRGEGRLLDDERHA